ncbi:MAG: WecB/TagA/CpsF family glycosyltransferase [Pseudomonadota bacterium]|nr:WecB/TagA/CpsF family glycosyltransferase [Pseudomonadota bacterium]
MPPDFSRNVRCVLGLPFDCVTQDQAEEGLLLAIDRRKRCFLSTPNLNFAVGCLNDADFRASVLQSDLSLADGWPIVAISRLVGAALPERIAGSSLFERLAASPRRPQVAVYFFGGPDGAARAACERLNSRPSGVVCAGFDSPGFGSIAEMGSATHLDRLNAARPDVVVVALGAKKGQAWILNNLDRIEAPVISHLGAVVNFVAGSVSRAPQWVQTARLEWLWRIKEEPSLWKRYARDGLSLLYLLATRVVPFAVQQLQSAPTSASLAQAASCRSEVAGRTVLRLAGDWTHVNVAPLRSLFASHAAAGGAVSIDLTDVSHLDSTAIALLALLYGWQLKTEASWEVVGTSRAVRKSLRLACADYLLRPRGSLSPVK